MIYAGDKMSCMQTRKGKIQIAVTPTPVPKHASLNITDTNSHDRREHYPNYYDIYDLFQNESFPPEDEDIDEYINIHKSVIHTVASRPEPIFLQ
jgi:hypothetical protein